jgi:hypothetical protein
MVPEFYADNFHDFTLISELVDQNLSQSISRDRKERQLAPQASAGYALSINSPLAFRKGRRRREKKASEKWQNSPPQIGKDMCLMIASKMIFLPGP